MLMTFTYTRPVVHKGHRQLHTCDMGKVGTVVAMIAKKI